MNVNTKLETFKAYIDNGNIECICSSPKSGGDFIHTFNYIGFDQHNRRLYRCNDCYNVYYIPKTKAEKRREFKLRKS
jgi:hypothetical protein